MRDSLIALSQRHSKRNDRFAASRAFLQHMASVSIHHVTAVCLAIAVLLMIKNSLDALRWAADHLELEKEVESFTSYMLGDPASAVAASLEQFTMQARSVQKDLNAAMTTVTLYRQDHIRRQHALEGKQDRVASAVRNNKGANSHGDLKGLSWNDIFQKIEDSSAHRDGDAEDASSLAAITTQLTYAVNSADKILYQLDNFEPMHHRFSNPNWNDIPMERRAQLSMPRKAFVVGMSTVARQTNYLCDTVRSLFHAVSKDQLEEMELVIFNANVPPDEHSDIACVRTSFSEQIRSGHIHIITRPESDLPHPAMRNEAALALRWGDSVERVKWRSKQVLDVAFLMDYVASSQHFRDAGYVYFLMMEDDIVVAKNFVLRVREWVDRRLALDTNWTMASFYNPWEVQDLERLPPYKFFGVIGQLFRVHDLPVIVEFLRKNFDQSPLDWLFVDFLKKFNGSVVCHTPSMFQHTGRVSSLAGKEQSGRSVDFAGTN